MSKHVARCTTEEYYALVRACRKGQVAYFRSKDAELLAKVKAIEARLMEQSRLRDEIDEPDGPERRLAHAVLAMLTAQRGFYKCPFRDNLAVARAAERSVDCRLAKIRAKNQGYQSLPFGD